MVNIIEAPNVFDVTNNWTDIQHTTLHQNQAINSNETNKLLKSFGMGSFFITKGFNLSLFTAKVDNVMSCIARLTPGIYVQDWTVIDYVQILKPLKQYIYVKVFDLNDYPMPGRIFRLGSRYYHGLIGDGIDSRPTYSKFESISENGDNVDFKTFYRFTLSSSYPIQSDTIDLTKINIDDLRFYPNNVDSLDIVDPWDPDISYDDESEEKSNTFNYNEAYSRTQSLMWSIVNSTY